MRILHLSFHVGCINDLTYVFQTLGHTIDYEKMSLPGCRVTPQIAEEYWQKHEARIQGYDVVLTSDTVALSYIFLRHLEELRPHLIILNCNRFDYGMNSEREFYSLLRQIHTHVKKVTYIPYTTFEQIWCARKGVYIHENPISPIGKWDPANTFTGKYILDDFGQIDRSNATTSDADTVFLQMYHNHTRFINLKDLLVSNDISVANGGYNYFHEIAGFKGLVVLPDAFSKYFAFESIQNELLVFLPTQRFLLELTGRPNYFFNIDNGNARLMPDWVNLCEWYHYPETRVYFDSFDDLIQKIKGLTHEQRTEKQRWMKFYAAKIEEDTLRRWETVLDKVALLTQG
jgi:hypothetical protein